ncbi:kinase-like protein [Aspergillus aculeatinus CBS 121060]|uniref:Kinase-like protein n=1 Tax=Aspergillus aculeatinus CBS 121060 TaxID=1448322 RepID=A0ACD1GRU9_9EURO|nr:kinase-like protein [Aspergillus aculeatinus CBS 121060]RAH63915.1 kinase-like protein [Aspergillus aculeatinus CBS 121060]
MPSPFLNPRGDPIPQEQVLGSGSSAVVLLQEGAAVKIPLRYLWSSDSDVEVNLSSLRREQSIYRRLQSDPDDPSSGIVDCLGCSAESTQLAYMANGDLRAYLETRRAPPSQELQLTWFRAMARTLCYIHDKRVLVADIATRNFLLDTELAVKICDFSEASLLPLESDMETADDNGYTTQIDVGLLGTVLYEVMTGTKCEIDLFKHNSPTDGRAYWPERKSLPSTEGLWLDWIVEGCWDVEFRSAHSLRRALDSVDLRQRPSSVNQPCTTAPFRLSTNRPITTVIGVLSLTMFTLMIGRRVFPVS